MWVEETVGEGRDERLKKKGKGEGLEEGGWG